MIGKNCIPDMPIIDELANKLVGETKESIKGLIALWQEDKGIDAPYPTASELAKFRTKLRGDNASTQNQKSIVTKATDKDRWTRDGVSKDPKTLYIFTDNTDRNSGSNLIDSNSWYAQKYGTDKHYPTQTTAVLRGLDNARPLSTQKHYNAQKKGITGRWSDEHFEEFKQTIDSEFEDIIEAMNSGQFDKVVLPNQIFGTKISNITQERTPKIYNYLQSKLHELEATNTNSQEAPIEIQEEEVNSKAFITDDLSTSNEQAEAILSLGVIKKADRVAYISRLFSAYLNNLIETNEESLDRRGVLNKYTPAGIFQLVFEHFEKYTQMTPEERVQIEVDTIKKMKGANKIPMERILAKANRDAEYKNEEYLKVLKNFRVLAEEASLILTTTERLRFMPSSMGVEEFENTVGQDNGEFFDEDSSDIPNNTDIYSKEESFKDNWMTNFAEVSNFDSLSQLVRNTLSNIPKLSYVAKADKFFIEKDDLGNPRYLDSSYTHATLMSGLRSMQTAKDMIPTLQKMAEQRPWVKQVILLLNKDPRLFSQFYQHFKKDAVSRWVQRRKLNSDGTYHIETIEVNSAMGISTVINEWRDNFESGTQFNENSVYNEVGEMNVDNAQLGLEKTEELNEKYSQMTKEDRLTALSKPEAVVEINELLQMLGISVADDTLGDILTENKDTKDIIYTDALMQLLPNLNVIFSGISKGKVKNKTVNGAVEQGDLINTFSGAYTNIATILAQINEDKVESSSREGGKTYATHTAPNYMGKIELLLRGEGKTEQEYQAMLEENFGKYPFFKKDGVWLNDWLKQLAEDPSIRSKFKFKNLLNYDRVEYAKWDSLDYTLVLLAEYNSEIENTSNKKFANYHFPIFSDSTNASFVKFRKYDNQSSLNENGKPLTFQEVLVEKFTEIVKQEVDRIYTVRLRDIARQKGQKGVEYIANYDILRDSKNPSLIKSKGGAEFKFLPGLNSLRFEGGLTFIQKYADLAENGSASELQSFIHESIETVLNEEFEETYKEWTKLGLLDENEDGNFKHMGVLGIKRGQSNYSSVLANSLNEAAEVLGEKWTSSMVSLTQALAENRPIDTKKANITLNNIRALLEQAVTEGITDEATADNISRKLVLRDYAKDKLREYFWNSEFATAQIIQLTATDLAYYKDFVDFQKRYKQVLSPALRLNTDSEYGRKVERTMYLKDSKIVSESLEDIKRVLQARVNANTMKAHEMAEIIAKFSSVDWADAQAYRSLSSYRAILDMSGQWTDEMQTAFDNFQKGVWDMNDFDIIWQTKKPFVYTQVSKNSGIKGKGDIKVGVQHKNSEFLLLAMHSIISGELKNSPKLQAINAFMENSNNNIDVIQFESTVKVGKQGVTNINEAQTFDEVTSILTEALKPNGVENPNVIHEISYEDYGIQVETPEHFLDAMQLVGTQIRKLVTSDMSDDPNFRVTVNGVKMTKQEVLDFYNRINTENILDSFQKVAKQFETPESVEAMLQKEIRGNDRYGTDMIKACTLNEDGVFNIPLFDPVISMQVQTLLNSVIKKNVTKQSIRGGALIQVSSYGLDNTLKMVFQDETGNALDWDIYKKDNPKATREQYEAFVLKARESGKLSIKYLEAYMPAYSRDFYEALMKEGTNELDIDRLPDSLRKIIGYRVPTEDKYSMAPIYIKGFLPQMNGSAIMLPAEITTLSGSDFDVDKLYVMFPEFKRIKYYNKKQFVEDLLETLKTDETYDKSKIDDYRESIYNALKNGRNAEEGSFDRTVWDTYRKPENREQYRDSSKDSFVKVDYDPLGDVSKMSRGARNNAMIDTMWGILTNQDTASKILNPGGFDPQQNAGNLITILKNMTKEELKRELNVSKDSEIMPKLINSNKIKLLAEKYSRKLNTLNPLTQVMLHQQNMMGAALISIYANHNASHALMQLTNLGLHDEHGSFVLNGKKLTALNGILNSELEFISKNNAGFLAAAVDNAKEAILATLNQNTLTADGSMLLSRLGYSVLEISVLMNQPIITEITNKFFRESREGKSKNAIIDEVIKKYKEQAKLVGSIDFNTYKDEKFLLTDLMTNIINKEEGERLTDKRDSSDADVVNYAKTQVSIGYLFKRILSSGEALSQLVQTSRADSQNGAAGPTIADTQIKIDRLTDFQNSLLDGKSPLINAHIIENISVENKSKDDIRRDLLSSTLPYLQAFHTLGIDHTQKLLGKYFPQFNASFQKVINGEGTLLGIRQYTKYNSLDVKTLNSIYNDLLLYIMTKKSFLGKETFANGESISGTERRKNFVLNFPKEFGKVVSENPEIGELEFIKSLRTNKANSKVPVDTLVFRNVGKLTPALKERYSRDWQTLLYMGPEAATLAVNLFRYSAYRNGFAFGPNSFMHLAPNAVREVVPEYISTLRELVDLEDDYSPFIEQYIYNHLDNTKLVSNIPTESSAIMFDESKEPLDEFTINLKGGIENRGDAAFVKESESINSLGENGEMVQTTLYTFMNFVSQKMGNKTYYYKLTANNGQKATYSMIKPLGVPNYFLEYEYGNMVDFVESVIPREIKRNSDEIRQEAQFFGEGISEAAYESMPNYDASMYSREAMDSAFEYMYGAKPENLQSTHSEYVANLEHRDANNNKTC